MLMTQQLASPLPVLDKQGLGMYTDYTRDTLLMMLILDRLTNCTKTIPVTLLTTHHVELLYHIIQFVISQSLFYILHLSFKGAFKITKSSFDFHSYNRIF